MENQVSSFHVAKIESLQDFFAPSKFFGLCSWEGALSACAVS